MINTYNCGKGIDNQDYKSLANFINELKEDIDLKNIYKKNSRMLFDENFSANSIVKKYDRLIQDIENK